MRRFSTGLLFLFLTHLNIHIAPFSDTTYLGLPNAFADGGGGGDGGDGGGDDGGDGDGDGDGGSDGDGDGDGGGDGDLDEQDFLSLFDDQILGMGVDFYSPGDQSKTLSQQEEKRLIDNDWDGLATDIASLPTLDNRSTEKTVQREVTTAATDTPLTHSPPLSTRTTPSSENPFPTEPLPVDYALPKSAGPADIAVIIGNANYENQGRDIPNVIPAYADAEAFYRYALHGLGIRPGNILYLRDSTQAQLIRVFGSEREHRGELHDWVIPGKSKVHVYFSGHGAPDIRGSERYLVPSDADASRLGLNGYSLNTLYQNLAQLPAAEVNVVLEACFSGMSQQGPLIPNASPLISVPELGRIPDSLTVIAAGRANQIASWRRDGAQSLFTEHFLKAMSGQADLPPYGNQDQKVSNDELKRYLDKTLTYWARRLYGRTQNATIHPGHSL